jgi:hypothetical protein
MWSGLPYPSCRVPRRELCRRLLLDELYVFGTATSLFYRSDLVRGPDPFYNEGNLHADMEVCLELLKACDFGFVHQVLTFKRWRSDSLGSITDELNTLIAGHLQNLVSYGRELLSPKEFERCLDTRLKEYYNFLAVSVLKGRRERRFWQYHRRKLNESGLGFSKVRLTGAMVARLGRALVNPAESFAKHSSGEGAAACTVTFSPAKLMLPRIRRCTPVCYDLGLSQLFDRPVCTRDGHLWAGRGHPTERRRRIKEHLAAALSEVQVTHLPASKV